MKHAPLPVHSPLSASPLDGAFARRVLGRREARRLAGLFDEAERLALARMEAARRDVDDIFASAREEARAILALLPDFAALEAVPAARGRSALTIIRREADAVGIAIAAITAARPSALARPARDRAIAALAAETRLDAGAIGKLFSIGEDTVRQVLRNAARAP